MTEKQYRLIVGTINHYADEDGWENFHMDASARGIWHPGLKLVVAPEFVAPMQKMPEELTSKFDEVRAHHVLEHLTASQAVEGLAECWRVLKPNGTLDVEVPDLDRLAEAWTARGGEHGSDWYPAGLLQWFYSEDLPNMGDAHMNAHCSGWNEDLLRAALEAASFVPQDREDTGLALRIRAGKVGGEEEAK